MDLADEIEVFRVAGNELTHDQADDGEIFLPLWRISSSTRATPSVATRLNR
jgi:hypothetical protein